MSSDTNLGSSILDFLNTISKKEQNPKVLWYKNEPAWLRFNQYLLSLTCFFFGIPDDQN